MGKSTSIMSKSTSDSTHSADAIGDDVSKTPVDATVSANVPCNVTSRNPKRSIDSIVDDGSLVSDDKRAKLKP